MQRWSGLLVIDDTCVFTHCSPGCGPWEYTTSAGCTACGEIGALVETRLEAAAVAQGGCVEDADCANANLALSCGQYCDLAVRADGLEALRAAASDIEREDCGSFQFYDCSPGPRECDRSGDARCIEGTCRQVAACEPGSFAPGDVCDDGDACTRDEVCGDAGCVGAPIDCDDGDPCTDDTCDPERGCVSTPNAAPCEAANTCSLGAQCVAGTCETSTASGFTRSYAAPYDAAEAIDVVGDTIYLGGYNGSGDPTAWVRTLDAAGEVLSKRRVPGLAAVTDLLALDDGIVVVGPATGDGLAVVRLDAEGAQVWRAEIDTERNEYGGSLARSGDALAVTFGEGEDQPTIRVALTDLSGRTPTIVTLGSRGYGYEYPIVGNEDGFIVAHIGGEPDTYSTVVSHLTRDGVVRRRVSLLVNDNDLRGMVALPAGDVLLWGLGATPWLRRVDEAITWELPLLVDEAVVRDGGIDVLATEGETNGHNHVGTGTQWIGRVTLSGTEAARVMLPRGMNVSDAVAIGGGFIAVANDASGVGHTADSSVWIRKATTTPCP